MMTRIAVVLGVVLVAAGCRTVEPPAPPEAPRISSFTANKTRIAAGEEVSLSFATVGATKVELVDDQGREVQLAGEVTEGTAKVAPTRSAFYVLRATGVGGRDTAFVQIAVNEPLKDLFLLAVPAVIDSGAQAQLLWGAPGATAVTLRAGDGTMQTLSGTTGTVTVTPIFTEQYTLTAQGVPGTPALTALAQVEVRPVLREAAFVAATGVKPGEVLRFTWTTAGASRVAVSERTFGQLQVVTDPGAVAMGSFDYTLPMALPNGVDISDGLPLFFTVAVTGGGTTVTRQFNAVVGELPAVDFLEAPEAVSAGRSFTLRWRTTNATQITVLAGGLPVFSTLPAEQARVAEGSVVLPAPTQPTEYVLVATNDRGGTARELVNVRPVALPAISTFTLAPSSINAFGDAVTARWTTTNASRVLIRLENGATLAVIEQAAQVANGNVALTLASGARLVLEAYNEADDQVSLTRAVTFNGAPVTITPELAVRGTPSTLAWTLSTAGVTEVVGLPASQADGGVVLAPVTSSPSFIDLTAAPVGEELEAVDPVSGSVTFTAPAGFRFPQFGVMQSTFTVGVDGVLSAGGSIPSGPNVSLVSAAAPGSVIAPFWDDLSLGMTSKLLYAVRRSMTGERILVVQWDDVQLAADAASSLTFQVQLYETGQVSFVYETLTGTLDSATIGVTYAPERVVQQYTFNSTTAQPAPGLELVFFAGLPADGMQTFNASSSRSYEFFGRTPTGLVPASVFQRVFGPGDVSITEAMPFPEASIASTGQWIELRNNSQKTVDFEGLVVSSTGSTPDGGYVIPFGTVVDGGGFIVLGQSTMSSDNGGAPVAQVLTDVPLAPADTVSVSLGGATLGSLSWDAGTPGTSNQARENVLLAAGGTLNCTRMRTFGSTGSIGTPGAPNEACGPYTVSPIAGAFRLGPANSAILGTIDSDSGYGNGTLPVPFRYFGTEYTAFSLSTNGLITLGHTLTSSWTGNDSTVGTSNPNGSVAVFWDDLERKSTGRQAMWREIDRTIISWEDFEIWTSVYVSVLNFQVHLIDSGAIEFHYGTMSTTSSTQSHIDRVSGDSATAWIENPAGTMAIPWSINTIRGIAPNSGVRFTPSSP